MGFCWKLLFADEDRTDSAEQAHYLAPEDHQRAANCPKDRGQRKDLVRANVQREAEAEQVSHHGRTPLESEFVLGNYGRRPAKCRRRLANPGNRHTSQDRDCRENPFQPA